MIHTTPRSHWATRPIAFALTRESDARSRMRAAVGVFSCLLTIALCSPAHSQSALDSKAATGDLNHDSGPTVNGGGAWSDNTGNQSLFLPQASSSAPLPGSFSAPANLALKVQGKKSLPQTRLTGFVKQSGNNDAIYGGDGELLPTYFGFDESHRIVRGNLSGDLSTGHPSDAPSAWGYPQ